MWLSLRLICQIRFSSCCCRCCWTLAAVLSHYCSPVRNTKIFTWDYRDEQQKNEIEEFYAKTRKPRESFEINTNSQSVRECVRSVPLAYSSHLLPSVCFFFFFKIPHSIVCLSCSTHTFALFNQDRSNNRYCLLASLCHSIYYTFCHRWIPRSECAHSHI